MLVEFKNNGKDAWPEDKLQVELKIDGDQSTRRVWMKGDELKPNETKVVKFQFGNEVKKMEMRVTTKNKMTVLMGWKNLVFK